MPPYQPGYQPYYQAYQPVYYAPPAPLPELPPYRPPVTRRKTIYMMIIVASFMISGLLLTIGIGLLASFVFDKLAYSQLEVHKGSGYEMRIPISWQAGEETTNATYTQAEFGETVLADDSDELAANLRLIFSQYEPGERQATRTPDSLKGQSEQILKHYLADYEKEIKCDNPTDRNEGVLAAEGSNQAMFSINEECRTDKGMLAVRAQFIIDRRGEVIIELLRMKPETLAKNKAIVNDMMKSPRLL